jgi:hypothetical protein
VRATENLLPLASRTAKLVSAMATNKDYLAYHHVDPVSVPLGEKIFMVIATGLVFVGLPLALAAIFHFVVPLIGSSWVN